MRTGNPTLNPNVFSDVYSSDWSNSMSVQGTTNKTFILLFISFITASWVWSSPTGLTSLLWPAMIAGFITAMLTTFKREWAPITAPIYAAVEGVFLGGISVYFQTIYPGIVMQAVGLTFGTMFALLAIYKAGIIKVTDNFRIGLFAATGGIALYYFLSILLNIFGINAPLIHDGGILGIGFSLIVVVVAALNLVLDFDFIEQGASMGAPKYMEWYGAFGLMVTLVWLYIEILRLLSKLRER